MYKKTLFTSLFGLLLLTGFSTVIYSQDDGTIPDKSQNQEVINNVYDENGYDVNGFDRNGYDKEAYNKSGINKDGYDRNGVYRHAKTGHEKANDGSTGTTGNTGTEESSIKTQAPPGNVDDK